MLKLRIAVARHDFKLDRLAGKWVKGRFSWGERVAILHVCEFWVFLRIIVGKSHSLDFMHFE